MPLVVARRRPRLPSWRASSSSSLPNCCRRPTDWPTPPIALAAATCDSSSAFRFFRSRTSSTASSNRRCNSESSADDAPPAFAASCSNSPIRSASASRSARRWTNSSESASLEAGRLASSCSISAARARKRWTSSRARANFCCSSSRSVAAPAVSRAVAKLAPRRFQRLGQVVAILGQESSLLVHARAFALPRRTFRLELLFQLAGIRSATLLVQRRMGVDLFVEGVSFRLERHPLELEGCSVGRQRGLFVGERLAFGATAPLSAAAAFLSAVIASRSAASAESCS